VLPRFNVTPLTLSKSTFKAFDVEIGTTTQSAIVPNSITCSNTSLTLYELLATRGIYNYR